MVSKKKKGKKKKKKNSYLYSRKMDHGIGKKGGYFMIGNGANLAHRDRQKIPCQLTLWFLRKNTSPKIKCSVSGYQTVPNFLP